MTWANRFRLVAGVTAILLLVAALTVVFNLRQSQVTSFSAEVRADVYTVGADYPGTVISQYVQPGATVTQGDLLFQVRSLQLKEAISAGLTVGSTTAYVIDPATGTITYRAVVDGTVTELAARQGNSISSGGTLATITVDSQPFVMADLRLAPRDYARLNSGAAARVLLSDGTQLTGTVRAISASTSERGTVTTVQVDAPDLAAVGAPLGSPGAPATVQVDLADSGPLAGVTDAVTDFLTQIGVR